MVMGQSGKSSVDGENHQAVIPGFLGGVGGRSCDSDPPVKLGLPSNMDGGNASTGADHAGGLTVPRLPEAFPSDYGGSRGSYSSASERRLGSQYDQLRRYSRSDNRLVGIKRSSSDTGFMGISREGLMMPRLVPESMESSHRNKNHLLWNRNGGEQHILKHHDKTSHGMQQIRPGPVSLMSPTRGAATDASLSKWEKSILINVERGVHCPPCVNQESRLGDQIPSNRLRGETTSPSVLSQQAADEGSRTGIKGSGISSFVIATRAVSEKNPAASGPNNSNVNLSTYNSELEPSNPPMHRLSSLSRQMTIIYRGQVHVFDDVDPNKAGVIMALAGSSRATWSTTLPKSSAKSTPHDE